MWSEETNEQPDKATPLDRDNGLVDQVTEGLFGDPTLPARAKEHAFKDEDVIAPGLTPKQRELLLELLRQFPITTAQTYGAVHKDTFHVRLDQSQPGPTYVKPRHEAVGPTASA